MSLARYLALSAAVAGMTAFNRGDFILGEKAVSAYRPNATIRNKLYKMHATKPRIKGGKKKRKKVK